jgi:hypothetical protein
MKIILNNAQSTPSINFIDSTGKITAQLSICKDGLLITGTIPSIPYCFPCTDGIELFAGNEEIDSGYLSIA